MPVVPKATRAQIVAAALSYAPFWKDIEVLPLTINMRLLTQAHHMTETDRLHAIEFAAWQLKLGDGTANHDAIKIVLPRGIIFFPSLLTFNKTYACRNQITKSMISSISYILMSMISMVFLTMKDGDISVSE